MTLPFINDNFLARMFVEGTNEFKEIKSEEHYIEGVGFTIALLGVEEESRYLVAFFGSDAVDPEKEGVYLFYDKAEADDLYQQLLSEHYSPDDYELITRG